MNLRNIGNGDPLVYLDDRDSSGGIVEQIAFMQDVDGATPAAKLFNIMADADGGPISFGGTTATPAEAELTYASGVRSAAITTGVTFEAEFVGESLDGPLGVMGIFAIAPSTVDAVVATGNFASGTGTNLNTTAHPTRANFHGSFGADLTGIETLISNIQNP